MLPKTLYHGSMYLTDILKPGFDHTHKEVKWDEGESNRFLYATTDRDMAIALGFASAIEKNYLLDNFNYHDGKVQIYLSEKKSSVALRDLEKMVVYLYAITVNRQDGWIKNNNSHNQLSTEFKTEQHIDRIDSVEQVNIQEWLATKSVSLHFKPPFTKW